MSFLVSPDKYAIITPADLAFLFTDLLLSVVPFPPKLLPSSVIKSKRVDSIQIWDVSGLLIPVRPLCHPPAVIPLFTLSPGLTATRLI